MKQNISSKTLLDIVGDSKDMDLSFITGKVNARRLERSKRNSTVTTDFTKECLNKYKIPFVDDTITNKLVPNNKIETNSNQTNKYKLLFFNQMDININSLVEGCEFMIPVVSTDYTNELHNYMIFDLPHEYFKVNLNYVPASADIKTTNYTGGVLFTYKFYLKSVNGTLF